MNLPRVRAGPGLDVRGICPGRVSLPASDDELDALAEAIASPRVPDVALHAARPQQLHARGDPQIGRAIQRAQLGIRGLPAQHVDVDGDDPAPAPAPVVTTPVVAATMHCVEHLVE